MGLVFSFQDVVLTQIQKVDDEYEAEICGSFRRGASSSGDIDILLTHPSYTSESGKKVKQTKALTWLMGELHFKSSKV